MVSYKSSYSARAQCAQTVSGSHRSRNALRDKDFLSPSRDKMCYVCDAMAPTCALAHAKRLGDLVLGLPRRSPAFMAPEVWATERRLRRLCPHSLCASQPRCTAAWGLLRSFEAAE